MRLLTVLGSVFAILIILFALFAARSALHYRSAASFVVETVDIVVPEWDKAALMERVPLVVQDYFPEPEVRQAFTTFRSSFVGYQGSGKATGKVEYQTGERTQATFEVPVAFESGTAIVTLTLERFGRYWGVTTFGVRRNSIEKDGSPPHVPAVPV